MVMVIQGAEAFDALAFGSQHPGTLNFLESQRTAVRNNLNEFGRQFLQTADTYMQRFNNAEFVRITRAALRKAQYVWRNDELMELKSIGEIQQAKPIMQRYIMAEPELRQMYIEQRVDGYSDTYVDLEPGRVGRDHYDYRRVVNAVFVPNEEDNLVSTTYYETLRADDRELYPTEQVAVLATWHGLKPLLLGKDDPTSVYNAAL